MELNIIIDDHSMNLNVPDAFIGQSGESFARLDQNMDRGVQFGPNWVDQPSKMQRCQIAADKLLTALENNNESLALLSAGYILNQMPAVSRVHIDTSGELQETRFE